MRTNMNTLGSIAVMVAGFVLTGEGQHATAKELKTPRLLVELPSDCNTPDGMCLMSSSVRLSNPTLTW